MIYTTYLAWQKHPKYWVAVAGCFSILLQLHYLTLLALPAAGLIWLISLRTHFSTGKLKAILLPSLIGLVIFLLSLVPLVLFDLKHQGVNFRAFQAMFTGNENFTALRETSVTRQLTETLQETEGRGLHILFEYMIGKNRVLNQTLLLAVVILFCVTILNKHEQKQPLAKEFVLLSYLGFGIVGTAFYQHSIFDHYIAYLFPITALVYGYVFSRLKPRWLAAVAFIIFTAYFLRFNWPQLIFKDTGWTIKDIEHTSQEILKRVESGEKYNLVLLSGSKDLDGQNYRYFLTTGHTRPVPPEQRNEVTTLFIIDEEKQSPKVIDLPIYEIVVFPNKQPAEVFTLENGPTITVLRRTTQETDQALE